MLYIDPRHPLTCNRGKKNKTQIDITNLITPPNLLGMDRKIA